MTPEAGRFIGKARRCLGNARAILAIGLAEDAGRAAYLAAFHAAQAVIFEMSGKIAKTHGGVQSALFDLTRTDARISAEYSRFLSQAYHLKAVADYETGPDAEVPLETARAAIEAAASMVDRIARILDETPGPPTDP